MINNINLQMLRRIQSEFIDLKNEKYQKLLIF